jgi:hypothetical protein
MKIIVFASLLMLTAAPLWSADESPAGKVDAQTKTLTGMSIVGNDEAPKSLYIVPWKSSEIGVETSLEMLANKDAVPLDRDVFKRQLDFYQVSHTNSARR